MDILDVIRQAVRVRAPYIQKNSIEAYRLLSYEQYPIIPIAIDIYKKNAVIHVFEYVTPEDLEALQRPLKAELGIESFFYKDRTKEEIELPKSEHKDITINEYGCTFSINLSDYLDTGLFLDHRETRKWIGEQSKGKRVLNTFAYTGSFSVHAARGGATLTHTVDLSRVYCEWIKKNFELNKMDIKTHWVLKMDTFEYFRYAKKKGFVFDIIIIDPPTFSRNKGESFSVQKDHSRLINEALSVLAPDGFILFSNNFKEFEMEEDKLNGASVREKQDSIPPDFEESLPHRSFVIMKA